jgi:integrase
MRGYSPRTEKAYVGWIVRYVKFCNGRHPRDCGQREVQAFATSLMSERNVASATQHQAVSAVLFMYRNVLRDPMGWTDGIVWAKRTRRLPTVLSPAEVARVVTALDGRDPLMVRLLYGTGMRLLELLRLRVKDVDFDNGSILIRSGKGQKDRVTVLPESLRDTLEAHLAVVRRQHERDVKRGGGYVEPPPRTRQKIARCASRLAMAVGFSCEPAVQGHHFRPDTAAPSARIGAPTRSDFGSAPKRHREACDVPWFPACVCNASAGGRVRHPDDPGIARAQRCQHDDDLHACVEQGWSRCTKPGGQTGHRAAASGRLT